MWGESILVPLLRDFLRKETKMERPKLLEIEEGDTNYQKGFKDGVWQQMQVQESLKLALAPNCAIHIYDTTRGNRCIRCGKLKECTV
jgi:hypothetical protein